MAESRKALGRLGEELVARALAARGYRIRERNWRCPAGELDIVAEDGDVLAFVEVKTRRGREFGTPEEAVTPAKQAKLVELASTRDLKTWNRLREPFLTPARLDHGVVENYERMLVQPVK